MSVFIKITRDYSYIPCSITFHLCSNNKYGFNQGIYVGLTIDI